MAAENSEYWAAVAMMLLRGPNLENKAWKGSEMNKY